MDGSAVSTGTATRSSSRRSRARCSLKRPVVLSIVVAGLVSLTLWLGGCAPPGTGADAPDLKSKAEAEASALVQQAQATAIILRAQATAEALTRDPRAASPTPPPTTLPAAPAASSVPTAQIRVTPRAAATAAAQARAETVGPPTAESETIELLGVGLGEEAGLISVQFKAAPRVAHGWRVGNVWVVDEATSIKYDNVPVTPIIGPLITRPNQYGQIGYVMLYNTNNGLGAGSTVTVVLGDFKREHVVVK
jgi:hypothetical protein